MHRMPLRPSNVATEGAHALAPFGGKEGENETSHGDLSKVQPLTDSASLTPISATISSMSSTTQSQHNSSQASPMPNDENTNETTGSSDSSAQHNSSNDSIDPFTTIQQAIEGLSMKEEEEATACEVPKDTLKEKKTPAEEEQSTPIEQKASTTEENNTEQFMNATHTIQNDSKPNDETFTAERTSTPEREAKGTNSKDHVSPEALFLDAVDHLSTTVRYLTRRRNEKFAQDTANASTGTIETEYFSQANDDSFEADANALDDILNPPLAESTPSYPDYKRHGVQARLNAVETDLNHTPIAQNEESASSTPVRATIIRRPNISTQEIGEGEKSKIKSIEETAQHEERDVNTPTGEEVINDEMTSTFTRDAIALHKIDVDDELTEMNEAGGSMDSLTPAPVMHSDTFVATEEDEQLHDQSLPINESISVETPQYTQNSALSPELAGQKFRAQIEAQMTRARQQWEEARRAEIDAIRRERDNYAKKCTEFESENAKLRAQCEQLIAFASECRQAVAAACAEMRQSTSMPAAAMTRESIEEIKRERDSALEDNRAVENAFADQSRRYQKMRTAVDQARENEAELKRVNAELQAKLKRMEERMQKLRAHAEGKLDEAQDEIDKLTAAREKDTVTLRAQVKKLQLENGSKDVMIEQLRKDNIELQQLCDELIDTQAAAVRDAEESSNE